MFSTPSPRTAAAPRHKATPAALGAGMITVGVILAVLRWAAGHYEHQIRDRVPALSPVLDHVLRWGWLGAVGVAIVGAGIMFLAARLAPTSGPDRATRIVAAALRVRPETIRCKTRWTGFARRRRPRRIVITYQSGTVEQAQVDELRQQLSTHWPAHYTTAWRPHRDRIDATETTPPAAAPEGQDTPSLDPVATDPLQRARQVATAHFGPLAEVTATENDIAGEPLSIDMRYPANPRASSELLRTRVGEEITRRLPGGTRAWTTSWHLQRDTLTLRRRPPLPQFVLHPIIEEDDCWSPNGITLPYATDGYGHAIGWDLNASTPHALVVGPTGTGKTVTLRSIATEAARRGVEVWIGDPKRIEMKGLKDWPGITRVCTAIPDIITMIETAHALMHARYEALEHNEVLRSDLTPLVIILDEYLIFWAGANRHWKQTKEKGQSGTKHPVLDLLQDLIVLARSSRIHLCFGVQRPDAELFQQGGRDSVRHRVSLGKLSPEGALMMWNNAHTGTAIDMTISGRATATTSTGEPDEVQTWLTPDPDPYLLERNPNALSDEEKAALDALRALAQQAQANRPEDDLTLLRRPAEPGTPSTAPEGQDIGGDEYTVPADVRTAVRARDLSPGAAIILDLDGADVRATINDVTIADETVSLEFTTTDGQTEILGLDPSDAIMVISAPPDQAQP